MTRPVWLRLFTCLWALWFGAVLTVAVVPAPRIVVHARRSTPHQA